MEKSQDNVREQFVDSEKVSVSQSITVAATESRGCCWWHRRGCRRWHCGKAGLLPTGRAQASNSGTDNRLGKSLANKAQHLEAVECPRRLEWSVMFVASGQRLALVETSSAKELVLRRKILSSTSFQQISRQRFVYLHSSSKAKDFNKTKHIR